MPNTTAVAAELRTIIKICSLLLLGWLLSARWKKKMNYRRITAKEGYRQQSLFHRKIYCVKSVHQNVVLGFDLWRFFFVQKRTCEMRTKLRNYPCSTVKCRTNRPLACILRLWCPSSTRIPLHIAETQWCQLPRKKCWQRCFCSGPMEDTILKRKAKNLFNRKHLVQDLATSTHKCHVRAVFCVLWPSFLSSLVRLRPEQRPVTGPIGTPSCENTEAEQRQLKKQFRVLFLSEDFSSFGESDLFLWNGQQENWSLLLTKKKQRKAADKYENISLAPAHFMTRLLRAPKTPFIN